MSINAIIAATISLSQPTGATSDAGEVKRCDDERIVAMAIDCDAPAARPGPYMIFFRWGGTMIDRDGGAILDRAAEAMSASDDDYQLVLSGHSDRSGPASVNERVAAKRAALVRDELVDRGVERSRIRIEKAAGERDLLVPTQDGVREAQNRRVEIHFEPVER